MRRKVPGLFPADVDLAVFGLEQGAAEQVGG